MSSSVGGASLSSLWNNPTLLGQLLGGVNVQGLQGVLQAEEAQVSAPLTQLSNEQSTLTAQAQAYSAVQGALQTVLTDAQGLQSAAAFNQTSAPVSSNANVATATGAGGPYGDWALAVTSLAMPGSINSAFQPGSSSASLGWNGTIQVTIYVGIPPQQTAVTVTVPVASSDSLNSIAQNIQSDAANALPSGTQLSAVVLPTTQNGQSGNVLSLSVNGGLTTAGVTTTGSVPNLGFTNATTFSPATYMINGVQNQSTTNTIQNAIPGVTLNLLATGNTNLSIASNPGATSVQVGSMVSDIQSAISTINKYTGQGQPLAGNGALESLVTQLESTLTTANTSLASGYQSLTDLGLSVSYSQTTGASISLNQSTLTNALTQNPQAVQNLMAGTEGVAAQIATLMQNFTQPSTGVIASYQSGIQNQEQLLASQETALQQTVGQQQTLLQTQFMAYLQQIANQYSQQTFLQQYVNLQSGQASNGSGSTTTGG
jgi:flagellar hook-associated protein 2